MTNDQPPRRHWRTWTIEIKVWKILVALFVLPILIMWYRVVHQDDEILALIRNEVVTSPAGGRIWEGTFVNTNSRTLSDVAVIVDFLDGQNQAVGRTEAEADELKEGDRLELRAQLPSDAARLRIYSVRWRMDRRGAMMGPFRQPWEFGYLMWDPSQ